MKILLSNDDGVHAKGLKILANVLSKIADITVVAPDRDRSGASNSLTLRHPLRVQQLDNGFYSVDGTPTDCVHLALTGLLEQQPDMVISGVNAGANLGDDIWYSGTVAAAIEGRYLGLPAIAISLAGHSLANYHTAATIAQQIALRLQNELLPAQTILNINVPDLSLTEIKGFEVTRLGTRHCAEPVYPAKDPRGHPIYWVGPPGSEQDAGPGTDFHAVSQASVSITPLQLDLTHYQSFERLSKWFHGMDLSAAQLD